MKEKKIGILDPEGKKLNPLTGKKYSDKYRERVPKWNKLKVYLKAEEIIKDIRENRVLIVEAATGTGKTVILPKLALHALDYKGKVVVTVPKRALAESSGNWAAMTLDVTDTNQANGKEVGYFFRGSDLAPGHAKDSAKLVFATDGYMINVIIDDPSFEAYDIIIVDEVHERSTRIDVILLLLRNALRLNPNLKVILMSATMPKDIFQDYFQEFEPKEISVTGVTKHVEILYSKKNIEPNNIEKETFDFFDKTVPRSKDENIIMFMPTKTLTNKIADSINKKYPNYKLFRISASNAAYEENNAEKTVQQLSGEDDVNYTKKIIITTNVWESSVTIKGLELVIDNGYEWSVTYDVFKMCNIAKNQYVSQGQAKQRSGRTGRTNEGIAYRLYTEKTYNSFLTNPVAPIKSQNALDAIWSFTNIIEDCTLKKLIDQTNQLIEPPEITKQKIYFRLLYDLGLLESWDENAKISTFGRHVQETAAADDLFMKVALVSSIKYSCSLEMCIMVSMISEFSSVKNLKKELFIIPPSDKDIIEDYVDKIIKKFRHPYGELFTMFRIANLYFEFSTYKNNKDNFENFIRRNKINKYRMDKVIENASSYLNRLPKNVAKENLDLPLDDRLLYSLLTGYFFNISKKDSDKTFMNFYPKIKSNRISPESKFMKDPEVMKKLNFIFYISLNKGFKTECSNICALPARILNLLPPNQKYFIIEREPINIKSKKKKIRKLKF